MISNNRFKRGYRKGSGNPSYAIIHDGDTEKWYFQLMKQEENIRIHIDYKIFKGNLRTVYEKVVELFSESYTQVFWIIDFDAILKEESERSKTSISPFEEFITIKEDAKQYSNKLLIVVNNPCLEFWYLLHYEKTKKHYPKYDPDLKRQLHKYLPGYEKKETFYKQANNLYKRLKPKQPIGIANAKSLEPFDGNNPSQASAEIFKVVEYFLK